MKRRTERPVRGAWAAVWQMKARTAARLAWATTTLAVTFGVLFLALLALNSRNPDVATYEYWGAGAVMAIVFPVVGAFIVSRHPRPRLALLPDRPQYGFVGSGTPVRCLRFRG
jgi:hypothetical protein